MSTALVETSSSVAHALTAAEMKAQIQRIQQVMKTVMKDKVHYGVVPGTPKPSLWKAGAEVLCAVFHIADSYRIEDLSDSRSMRYRVTCIGTHQVSGIVLGEGVGAASSNEEKYQWRDAICDEEFDEADEDQRRRKWQKGYNRNDPPYRRLQIRTDPANSDNTVLKMACKRAKIAMTLNVVAASDIFTQDLEDMPDEMRGSIADEHGNGGGQQPARTRGKPATQAPRSRSSSSSNTAGAGQQQSTGGRCSERQANFIAMKADQAGIPQNELLRRFAITAIEEAPFAKVNEILAWIANPDGGAEDTAREPGSDDAEQSA